MPEVVRIRKKVKEQEKKQLLSLITMDEFLLEKQKDYIVDEINSILMDATSALLLGQHPIARPISADKIALRKFYYYRLDRTHLIADIQVRVRAPRCHVTFYYSMLCTMDEDFCFGTYGFWMDKPERDELPLDKYLVPYLGWENIEAETENIWHRRLPAVFSEPRWLKAYHLANRMDLTIIQRRLPKTRIRSVVFFQEKTIEVEDDLRQIVEETIPAGTIILNMKVIRSSPSNLLTRMWLMYSKSGSLNQSRICKTMELDERYASVIVDRFIQFHEGSTQNVKVLRDGIVLSYEEAIYAVNDAG